MFEKVWKMSKAYSSRASRIAQLIIYSKYSKSIETPVSFDLKIHKIKTNDNLFFIIFR